MKLKVYVIDVQVPRWLKPSKSIVAACALLAVVGATSFVRAEPKNTFKANELVSAAKLNENFSSLDTRLAAVEQRGGGGTFCGASSATTGTFADPTGSGANGYRAAKLICEGVAGCGPTAHMCDGYEIAHSAELGRLAGVPANSYWVKSPIYTAIGAANNRDCVGWRSSTVDEYGGAWGINVNGGPTLALLIQPGQNKCDVPVPVACCK